MPIDLNVLCRQIEPENTILLFGAGSSIPSGGKSGNELAQQIAGRFKIDNADRYNLMEISSLAEKRTSRRDLILFLQKVLKPIKATGAILNTPLYNWHAIYTTNYDTIIEQAYERAGKDPSVVASNFDFQVKDHGADIRIFKLHGTIQRDFALGHKERMVITESDYDETSQYREILYGHFQTSISSGHVVILGHSLSDPDLKECINEALRRKKQSGAQCKILLVCYEEDTERAALFEDRGISVCFASLDEFFSELEYGSPERAIALNTTGDPLDSRPRLRPSTTDVSHAVTSGDADVAKMFNGRAATYADIAGDFTFERTLADSLETQLFQDKKPIVVVLGAAGVGKSTLARQVLVRLLERGVFCWEHNDDLPFLSDEWVVVASQLKNDGKRGVLLVDDCHNHLREVNRLADTFGEDSSLKLILLSTKHQWNPRIKSPSIFANGEVYEMSRLRDAEITSLLDLLEREPKIRELAEKKFQGFSRSEQRRRLQDRCGADMFVCMKNIFSFERIDHIILREYGDLDTNLQDIYRTVSAMESSGVRVHRQLIIRTLGIPPASIASILDNLTDIITEYTIDRREGLYGWRGRHSVIANILTSYKFNDQAEYYKLLENIIEHLNPSYDLELSTIRSLCDMERGIGRIVDRNRQNILFRKMISLAPSERVPRHRLIRNLIAQGDLEPAESEIRIFEKELRVDPPVFRAKVLLQLRRAESTEGLMTEDRVAIISNAAALAREGIRRFSEDKKLFGVFCDLGLSYAKYSGDWSVFDEALSEFKHAESRILDPDVSRMISNYEGLARNQSRGKA